MHMLSGKDLKTAELETVRVSNNPATILTANEEVQPNEEETVCVYDFDVFLTVQIVVDTSSVLSFGKRCEDHGYSNEWISGLKTRLSEAARKYNVTRRITHPSLFQACQPNLPARLRVHPQHRYRRTQCEMILRQVQQPHEVGVHSRALGDIGASTAFL